MASGEFARHGSSESEHCHASIQLFNKAQGAGVPGAPGGEPFTKGFQWFVLILVLRHGSESQLQEPMRLSQDRARLDDSIGVS